MTKAASKLSDSHVSPSRLATPPRVARRSSSGDGDLTGCAAELLASRCRSGGALAYHSADDDNAATTMRMEGLT
jgi:hypothetical protein